jgi:hypothetical protein
MRSNDTRVPYLPEWLVGWRRATSALNGQSGTVDDGLPSETFSNRQAHYAMACRRDAPFGGEPALNTNDTRQADL